MNIGIVTTWFERGAAYVSKQFKTLLENEHEVFIYGRAGEQYAKEDPNWDGPNVTWAKPVFDGHNTRVDLVEFRNWIESNKIETILFNEQNWFPVLLLARQLGVKVGGYVDFYRRDTVKNFKLYDFLICNTKRHYSVFDWHPQCYYVPWGTDIELFRPSVGVSENSKVRFFYSGGVDPVFRKGGDLLIRAFHQIKDEDCELIIHSQIPLDPLLGKTDRDILGTLVGEQRVRLIIETVPAPGLFHLGDVYVYPTRLEGIGLSMVEALSCGLPIIVPDIGPMNEFVNADTGSLVNVDQYLGHHNGYYWPLGEVSIDDLARKMKWYIDQRERIPEMKDSARAYALQERNWHNRREEVLNIFSKSKILTPDLSDLDSVSMIDEFSSFELLKKVRQDLTRVFVKGPSKFWRVS